MLSGLFQLSSLSRFVGVIHALAIAFLWTVFSSLCWGQNPIQERFSDWVDTAPPGIKRLIDLGQVRFEVNDQELAVRQKQGLTKFEFDYRFRYRFSTSGPKRTDTQVSPAIAVSATIILTEVNWKHQVILGQAFNPQQPWQSRLLQHEFDHVSISTDPRLKLLLRRTLGAPLEFEIPIETAPDESDGSLDKRIDRRIGELMQERVRELERVTQALNDRFDEESNSGGRSIRERANFFREFFAPEVLAKLGFRFPEILDGYSKAIAKADWEEHYILNSPP